MSIENRQRELNWKEPERHTIIVNLSPDRMFFQESNEPEQLGWEMKSRQSKTTQYGVIDHEYQLSLADRTDWSAHLQQIQPGTKD